MPVLQALNLSQLQNIQHVLQEMEMSGVTDISIAKLHVATEIKRQHAQRKSEVKITKNRRRRCKNCGGLLSIITDADHESGENIVVFQCKKCRWSTIDGDNL